MTRRDFALFALVASLAGCTLGNLSPTQRFSEAAFVVNDSSRWGRPDAAAEYVSLKYQPEFLTKRQNWGQGIQIAEADVVRMHIADDGESAMSDVYVSWYAQDLSVRSSLISQRWVVDRGKFFLAEERVLRGDPAVFPEATGGSGGEISEPGPG